MTPKAILVAVLKAVSQQAERYVRTPQAAENCHSSTLGLHDKQTSIDSNEIH